MAGEGQVVLSLSCCVVNTYTVSALPGSPEVNLGGQEALV